MSEERLEQVREIDGEQAYEKMRRAVEKASQEKASQEKASQVERARQVERKAGEGYARDGKAKQGAAVGRNAGGRSGTLTPAASLVLLRGRGRMGQTDWGGGAGSSTTGPQVGGLMSRSPLDLRERQ